MVDSLVFIGDMNPSFVVPLETLVEEMKKANIEIGIVAHFSGVFYNFAEGNYLLGQLVEKQENLYAYLSANPHYPQHSIADMRKRLTNNKFVALYFAPTHWGVDWNDPSVKEILNAYRRFAKPLVAHFPRKDGSVEGISKEFSPMKNLLVGIKSEEWKDALRIAKNSPNVFLEVGPFLLPSDIKMGVETLGAHRFIMGSNYPFFPISQVLYLIERSGISERDKMMLVSQNARKFFAIGGEER